MTFSDLDTLKILVKTAAREIVLAEFGQCGFEYKDDGSVVTPADLAMQNRLESELKQHWPMYDLLGEEMSDAQQQQVIDADRNGASGGYWCLDPLDGTSNYAAGLPFFAVSVALIVQGEQQLGLIYDPVRDEMFTALRGQGAFLNDRPVHSCDRPDLGNKPVIAEIDLKRLPEELAVKLVRESIFASQRNIGSSALDWCWLTAGRFDVYLHGGQKLWDYAAGSLIFAEAGGFSQSLDNEPVFRGQLELRSALACHDKALFEFWREWIGAALPRSE
ncbi:MAG TPA: inositol monophosphatase [Gammaproteobacteria bacterium]|nr:inositol monophosphatase [Gammaproteobacteria bacterium]